MGSWGTGIFDDDVALDIRGEFEDALAEGMSVEEATSRILESWREAVEGPDDGSTISLALAALQLEHERVQPAVRDRALAIIASGESLTRWEEAGADDLAERRRVLDRLRSALAGE